MSFNHNHHFHQHNNNNNHRQSDRPSKGQTVHLSHCPGEYVQSKLRHSSRRFSLELTGTFVFVYLSQAALTSFELMGTQNETISRQLAVTVMLGLAYLMASELTMKLSDAHLNPAYTMASYLFDGGSFKEALGRQLAQYSGAFLAAVFLHISYYDKLSQRHSEGLFSGMNATLRAHGNILSTGKLFTSQPPTEASLAQLFVSYLLASSLFTMLIVAIRDSKLVNIPCHLRPVYMAAALTLVQAAFAANGGPVLNPAQDFAPRLYIFLFGWGPAAFNLYRYLYWWLCGLVAPYAGAACGFLAYRVLCLADGPPYRQVAHNQTNEEQLVQH